MNKCGNKLAYGKTINVVILVIAAVGLGMVIGDRSSIGWMIYLIGIMTFSISSTIESGHWVKERLIAIALTMLGAAAVGSLALWFFSRQLAKEVSMYLSPDGQVPSLAWLGSGGSVLPIRLAQEYCARVCVLAEICPGQKNTVNA